MASSVVVSMNEHGVPESTILYRTFRRVYRGRRRPVEQDGTTKAYDSGRDPAQISNAFSGLASQLGWGNDLIRARIANDWADIVGPSVAEHSWPTFDDTVLTIRCASTAWASSLRMMRSTIEGTLRDSYPDLAITNIHFRGPDAPSWKRGPRSVPGRGPRDTYG